MENEVNKQESITRSLRLSADKIDDYDRVKKAFGTTNEFTDWIISAYTLYESQQTSDLFKQDTKAVMDMFNSIFGTINGIVSRAEGIVQSKDEDIKAELRAKDLRVEELKADNEALQNVISEKDTEIKAQKDISKDLQSQLKEQSELLEKAQKDYSNVSKINEFLEKEKAQYKAISEENKTLIEEVKALKESLKESENRANTEGQKVIELTKDKEHMEVAHKQAISYLESMKANEINEARLKVEEQAQVKIREYMDREQKLSDKVNSLNDLVNSYKVSVIDKERDIADLQKEIAELNKTIEELKAALQNNNKKTSKVK